MIFPVSFWKPSGPPPFDPATLSLDYWQAPDYPGATFAWPGTASAGTSGAHSDAASTLAAGSTVNGHVPIHVAAGGASISVEHIDSYVTAGQFSGAVVFNSSTAPADAGAGSRVLNAAIVGCDSGNCFGVAFSTAGVTFWILSSFVGYVEVTIACPTGGWNCLQFKYDGTHITVRLNGGSWSAPAAVVSGFNGTALNTVKYRVGGNTFESTTATADVAETFLSKSLLSNTDFDNYLSAMRTKYAQPF